MIELQNKDIIARETITVQYTTCSNEYMKDHIFELKREIWRNHRPSQFYTQLKVYMTDIFFYLSQCTDMYNKEKFSIAILAEKIDSHVSSPCFDVPKTWNFTSGGIQNCETKKRRPGIIVTSFQDFKIRQKTDFSVTFLLWANRFTEKWYNSALFIRK